MTVREILMSAAGSAAPAAVSTFAKTFDYGSASIIGANTIPLTSGKLVFAFYTPSGAGFQILNADGTLDGQAFFISGLTGTLVSVDASDNLYVGHNLGVIKCNTSGTIAWQKTGFTSALASVAMNQPTYNATNGTVIIAGCTTGSTSQSLCSVLDASTGAHVWSRTMAFTAVRTELIRSAVAGSNYFVGGLFGNYDAGIIKFDSTGTAQYQVKHGFDMTSLSANNSTGNAALATYNSQPAPGVRVFNTTGTCISGVNYGTVGTSPNFTQPVILLNSDGTYVAAMRDIANVTYNQICVFKHGPAGNVLWSKSYRWSSNVVMTLAGYNLSTDASGNYVVTGSVASTTNDALVLNIDSATGNVTTSASWIQGSPSMTSTASTALSATTSNRTITTVTPTLTNSAYAFTRITLTQVLTN